MKRRDKLVLANLGIVDKIAGGYARRVPAMLFDDLRQAGMMGLLDAATRFDAVARRALRGVRNYPGARARCSTRSGRAPSTRACSSSARPTR